MELVLGEVCGQFNSLLNPIRTQPLVLVLRAQATALLLQGLNLFKVYLLGSLATSMLIISLSRSWYEREVGHFILL